MKRTIIVNLSLFFVYLLALTLAGDATLRAEELGQELPGRNIKFDLSPAVLFYNGDVLRSSTLAGISATYHFNRTWWLGGDFAMGPLNVDSPNGVGLKRDDLLSYGDGAVYWNLPALLGSRDGMSADLYTSLGLGVMRMGHKNEMMGFIGGGLFLHTGLEYLSVRFDLKNIFFKLDNSAGTDFNSDLILGIGPSLIF